MNGMNKAVVATVYGIALLYTGLCFALTVLNYNDTEVLKLEVILPFIEISDRGPLSLFFATMVETLFGWTHSIAAMYFVLIVGFIISVAGMFTPYALEVKGVENQAEIIWTERKNSLARCLSAPWGFIIFAFNKKRPLAVIPIILLPLYAWWSVLLTLSLLPTFVLLKLVIGSLVNSARRKDEVAYHRNAQYAVCPICKRNFLYPKVRCGCGIILDYPSPGIHGLSSITCNNGHTMPSRWGFRDSLNTICPHCEEPIQTRESKPICVSLAGSVGSGKTTLMLSSVQSLFKSAVNHGVTPEAITSGISESAVAGRMDAAATPEGELDSECMFLRSPYLHGREIVFNDISGREFEPKANRYIFQEYYTYTDGIVFCVDPLSLDSRTSKVRPMDVFESFHYIFSRVKGFGPGTVSEVPFALVLTKKDITGVDDGGVERYLLENGQVEFLNVLKSLFSDVGFFSINCYDEGARPVWWIIGKSDPELVEHVPMEM